MAQHLFAAETAPTLVNLDANFTDLYNKCITYSYKAVSGAADAFPASIGANCIASPGSSNSFRVGFGLNISYDGTNWRTGTDGSSNGGGAVLFNYTGGILEFHISPTSGGTSKTISNASMTPVMSMGTTAFIPSSDNSLSLGIGGNRYSTIYAGTGTINTSDAREKTVVSALIAAEVSAAQELVECIGTYQWLSAVQVKGQGDARKHIGMTVQQAVTIMTAHGLDPMSYGFICYDSWPELKDEDGTVLREAGDRYSFRPDELGMFIARGVSARMASIEARLTAAGF